MPNRTSERLKKNSAEIMNAWEKRANAEVLSALNLESLALRDSLPELLDHISDGLSTTIDRTSVRAKWDRSEGLRIGKKHGDERAASMAYTMDQMIFEYHILRQVIFDVMEEQIQLTPAEREVIICAIEQAVNDAATQFSNRVKVMQEKLAQALTHDLRSPLTSARISAERIMLAKGNAERCAQFATRIIMSIDRLDHMVEDLLDASLIQAGQHVPVSFAECDLNRIASQVVNSLKDAHGDRFLINGDLGVLGNWSERSLYRIIENLVTNAVKYGTPDTPITLSVQQSEPRTQLRIHNHGEPIAEKDQKNLFQRYRRASSANKEHGYGLGLTVVKGLIEAHKGTIEIESHQGRGTVFIINLPNDSSLKQADPLEH